MKMEKIGKESCGGKSCDPAPQRSSATSILGSSSSSPSSSPSSSVCWPGVLTNNKNSISSDLFSILSTGNHDQHDIGVITTTPPAVEDPDPSSADSLIAHDMASSSQKDLQQAYYDVHGISSEEELIETPELIDTSLAQFDLEIKRLSNRNQAYLQAESMNQDYVQNQDFRLMFLRADRFHINDAANRFLRHFQVKLDLFGTDKLTLDITQDDLDSDSLDALYSSSTQLAPMPDRGGRAVAIWNGNGMQNSFTSLGKQRRMFYHGMTGISRYPQLPKLGLAFIIYFFGAKPGAKRPSFEVVRKLAKISSALPFRLAALHLCYDSMACLPIHAFIKVAVSVFDRLRLRSHYGSYGECLASLQGYGIQQCFLPIEEGGKITTKLYVQWLEEQRRKERRTKPRRNRIFVPGLFDVLFGKGSPLQNHTGNVKLRGLIADCREKYDKAEKGQKSFVSRAVVETVKQSSGLFLKQDDGAWIVVGDSQAELKVATLFRSLRDPKRSSRRVQGVGL